MKKLIFHLSMRIVYTLSCLFSIQHVQCIKLKWNRNSNGRSWTHNTFIIAKIRFFRAFSSFLLDTRVVICLDIRINYTFMNGMYLCVFRYVCMCVWISWLSILATYPFLDFFEWNNERGTNGSSDHSFCFLHQIFNQMWRIKSYKPVQGVP